jgi:hypothetical protein
MAYKYISKSDIFMMDGTFRICPVNFFQFFVIHGEIFGKGYPLVFILMKLKTQKAYVKLFEELCKLKFLNLKYIISDFELAALNAAKLIFPNVNFCACLFHFAQSAWRNIQNLNLTVNIRIILF